MEQVAPLFDAAAWWLSVDAGLRIMWNLVGLFALIIGAAVFGLLFVGMVMEAAERSKDKGGK